LPNTTKNLSIVSRSLIRLLLAAEKGYTIFAIIYFSGAFVPLYKEEYSFINRLDFYLPKILVIIAFLLLVIRWKRAISIVLKSKLLLLFLTICMLSTLWSDVPGRTRDAAQLLIETTIFALYLATRYTLQEQTNIFTWVFGISAIFSLLYVFALPKYGRTQTLENQGTWRGIYVQKNNMGSRMVLGGIFFLVNIFSKPKYRWIYFSCLAIIIILIQGSNSKSALVSFLFVAAISPLNRILRWNPYVAIPLYLIIVLVGGTGASFLGMNWDAALGSINKRPDLNGRVPIWELGIEWFLKRPWLGYGYAGFWRAWEGEGSAAVLRSIIERYGWEPKTAHNGFLELFMDLGIVGGLVYMVLFFKTLMHAINRIRSIPTMEGFWPLGFITYYIIINITMSFLIVPYDIFWLIFATITLTPINPSPSNKANQNSQIYLPSNIPKYYQ